MDRPRSPSDARRYRRRTLRSLWWRYRPLLAGLTVFWLVLAIVPVLQPPSTRTTPVLVATRDLEAGAVIADDDVTLAHFPVGLAPPSSMGEAHAALGHQLRQGVATGSPLLPSALADDGWGLGEDELAVPVRLADPLVSSLLESGDTLELVSADGEAAASLTQDARVLALVADPGGSSMLSGAAPSSPLLLVAVPRSVGTQVLDASARGTLTAALVSAPVSRRSA